MENRSSNVKKISEQKILQQVDNSMKTRESLTVAQLQNRIKMKQQKVPDAPLANILSGGLNALKKPIVDRFDYASSVGQQQKRMTGRLLTEIIPHIGRTSQNCESYKYNFGIKTPQRSSTQTNQEPSKLSRFSKHEHVQTEPNQQIKPKQTIFRNIREQRISNNDEKAPNKSPDNIRAHSSFRQKRGNCLTKKPRNTIGDTRNLRSLIPSIKPIRNKTISGIDSSIAEQSDEMSISGFTNESGDDIKQDLEIGKGNNITRMSTKFNSSASSNHFIEGKNYNQSAKKYSSVKPFRSSNLSKFDILSMNKAKQQFQEAQKEQKPKEPEEAKKTEEPVQTFQPQPQRQIIRPKQTVGNQNGQHSSARNHHRRKGFGLAPKQSIFKQLNIDQIIHDHYVQQSVPIQAQGKQKVPKACRQSIQVMCNIIEAISQDRPDVLKFIISVDDTHQERLKKLEEVKTVLENEYSSDSSAIKVISLIEAYSRKWKRILKENWNVNRQQDQAIILQMLNGMECYSNPLTKVDPCVPLRPKYHKNDDFHKIIERRHSRLANVQFDIDWKQEVAKHCCPSRLPQQGQSADNILKQSGLGQISLLEFINRSNNHSICVNRSFSRKQTLKKVTSKLKIF